MKMHCFLLSRVGHATMLSFFFSVTSIRTIWCSFPPIRYSSTSVLITSHLGYSFWAVCGCTLAAQRSALTLMKPRPAHTNARLLAAASV